MTDDEIRAEVNALIASGENGEGAAIESDYLWAAFESFWNTKARAFLGILPNDDATEVLKRRLGAAFEAGWDAYADEFKAGRAEW